MAKDRTTTVFAAAALVSTIRENGGRLRLELNNLETLLNWSLKKALQLQSIQNQRAHPEAANLQKELTQMRIGARRTLRRVWKHLDAINSALDLSPCNSEGATKNEDGATFYHC